MASRGNKTRADLAAVGEGESASKQKDDVPRHHAMNGGPVQQSGSRAWSTRVCHAQCKLAIRTGTRTTR